MFPKIRGKTPPKMDGGLSWKTLLKQIPWIWGARFPPYFWFNTHLIKVMILTASLSFCLFDADLGSVDQSESMASQCKVLCRTEVSVFGVCSDDVQGDPNIIRLDRKWQILAVFRWWLVASAGELLLSPRHLN